MMFEAVSGIRVVKSFNAEEFECKRLHHLQHAIQKKHPFPRDGESVPAAGKNVCESGGADHDFDSCGL